MASMTDSGNLPLGAAVARQWWLFLVRGIAALLFGVLAIALPGLTILSLTLLWGAFALLDGGLSLWAGLYGDRPSRGPRWWLILHGVLGIAAGLLALVAPGFTAVILLLAIAVWAIVVGVLQIAGAVALRREIENEWLLAVSGALSLLFGVFFLLQPAAGALAVVWLIAFFAIVLGVNLVVLAFRLKRHGRVLEDARA